MGESLVGVAFRWNYKRAFLRCALLLAAGTTLQLLSGDVPVHFLHHPWSTVLAVNYLYLLVLAFSFSGRSRLLRSLWDDRACISSLAAVLVLVTLSGFHRITETWPFILVLFYFMTATGIRAVSEISGIRHLRGCHYRHVLRYLARTVVHAGVFLFIFAGIFGGGDKIRCKVVAPAGGAVAMGEDSSGESIPLPFTLTLKEFTIEEYPPKLYVVDTLSGKMSDGFVSADTAGSAGYVDGWRLTADTCLFMAGRLPGESGYRAMEHVGAVPAVFVTAVRESDGSSHSGWVSCGSHIFSSETLGLGYGKMVVMPRPEARRFSSEVVIADADGRRREETIEVNRPAMAGAWRIYQAGYDTSRGRWSTVSVMECVRDSWWIVTCVSLWMLLSGTVLFAVSAGSSGPVKKREEGK